VASAPGEPSPALLNGRGIIVTKRSTLLGALGIAWLLGAPAVAGALHPVDISLKDVDGNVIRVGEPARPYSPKQTCGRCHNYESDPVSVSKQQTVAGVANPAYAVPVASHGASAGYHFQQGMNVEWSQVQRDFYKVPSFTSSPGMVGKL
jgi:hypothetical protein